MKKIIFIIVIIILITGGTMFVIKNRDNKLLDEQIKRNHVSFCTDENKKEIDCKECIKKGKLFPSSFGDFCEMESKDVGKDCLYSDECTRECIYDNKNAIKGKCDGYGGDNAAPRETCTRSRDKEVECSRYLS